MLSRPLLRPHRKPSSRVRLKFQRQSSRLLPFLRSLHQWLRLQHQSPNLLRSLLLWNPNQLLKLRLSQKSRHLNPNRLLQHQKPFSRLQRLLLKLQRQNPSQLRLRQSLRLLPNLWLRLPHQC